MSFHRAARSAVLATKASVARPTITSSHRGLVTLSAIRVGGNTSHIRSPRAQRLAFQEDMVSFLGPRRSISSTETSDFPIVSYDELKPRTEQPTGDWYLIDVREPDEVAEGAIPSAVVLPLTGFTAALSLPPDQFRNKFGFEKPTKKQEIIFYCRSGKRARTASEAAKANGYRNVKIYDGSWLDWVEREQGQKK